MGDDIQFPTNNVILICHYEPDCGWYALAAANDGLYILFACGETPEQYETLFEGDQLLSTLARM